MARQEETYVLVRKATTLGDELKVVRTYLSQSRAQEDLDLLVDSDPANDYQIITAHFIDA